jgi:hypothetical protein
MRLASHPTADFVSVEIPSFGRAIHYQLVQKTAVIAFTTRRSAKFCCIWIPTNVPLFSMTTEASRRLHAAWLSRSGTFHVANAPRIGVKNPPSVEDVVGKIVSRCQSLHQNRFPMVGRRNSSPINRHLIETLAQILTTERQASWRSKLSYKFGKRC